MKHFTSAVHATTHFGAVGFLPTLPVHRRIILTAWQFQLERACTTNFADSAVIHV